MKGFTIHSLNHIDAKHLNEHNRNQNEMGGSISSLKHDIKERKMKRRKVKGQEMIRQLIDGKSTCEVDWEVVIAIANQLHIQETNPHQTNIDKKQLKAKEKQFRRIKRQEKKQQRENERYKRDKKRFAASVNASGYSVNMLSFTFGDDNTKPKPYAKSYSRSGKTHSTYSASSINSGVFDDL